jgi:hypothetical protein
MSGKTEVEVVPLVGRNYFVRTVTDHYVGRCVGLGVHTIVLDRASWVANSGRLSVFMREGRAAEMEVEVFPAAVLVRAPLTGATVLDWPHALFTETV